VLVHTVGQIQVDSADLANERQVSTVKSFIAVVNAHLKDIFSSRS
jgi:hypothetical protein